MNIFPFDQYVSGSDADFLREEIMNSFLVDAKISIVERWLLRRLRKIESIQEAVVQYAVEETLLNPTQASMKAVADKTGYSQQHFINLFKKYMGLSPKQYQRIVRFNQTLIEIEKSQQIDWASLSVDLGYYDQPHFIKDFRKF